MKINRPHYGRSTLLFFFICVPLILFISSGVGQEAEEENKTEPAEPTVIYKISIADTALIRQILRDQKQLVSGPIKRMDIYDLQNNGFGDNDVAVLKPHRPKQPPLFLTGMSEETKEELSRLPEVQIQDISMIAKVSDPKILEEKRDPIYGILASIIMGIDRNYHDKPIKLVFERNRSKMRLRVWGFNPDSLRFSPSGKGGGGGGYDVYNVLRADTTVMADTTMYDVIYIYRRYADTLYVPRESRSSEDKKGIQ